MLKVEIYEHVAAQIPDWAIWRRTKIEFRPLTIAKEGGALTLTILNLIRFLNKLEF